MSTGEMRGEGVGDRLKRGIPSIDYNINKYENYNLARVNASGNDLYFMREIREKGRTCFLESGERVVYNFKFPLVHLANLTVQLQKGRLVAERLAKEARGTLVTRMRAKKVGQLFWMLKSKLETYLVPYCTSDLEKYIVLGGRGEGGSENGNGGKMKVLWGKLRINLWT